MSLSQELHEIYSSNVLDVMAYDTIELSHSLFTKSYYFIQDNVSHNLQLEDSSIVEFEPFGFSINLPTKGSNQQDMGLVFENVGQVLMKELELAAGNIKENIICTYRVYIDGSDLQQNDSHILGLTNITATPFNITANASRISLYDRFVPAKRFEPQVFIGIS